MATRSLLLSDEHSPIYTNAPITVGLVWPNSYETGMSSLGFLWAYRELNVPDRVGCERFFAGAPTWEPGREALSLERNTPLTACDVIAVSIAYEPDVIGLIRVLHDAGIPALASARTGEDPAVVIGGPLTRANHHLLTAFADVVVAGDGDAAMAALVDALGRGIVDGAGLQAELADVPGVATRERLLAGPYQDPAPPLPIVAPLTTPNASLADLLLVEVSRGCPQNCTFCLGRRENSPLRSAHTSEILAALPEDAPGIGVIGAALSYHPGLHDFLDWGIAHERGVGISSLRAEQVDLELARKLRATGSEVLTIAADGCSERVRTQILKRVREEDLVRAAEHGRKAGLHALKLYLMLGLPGEEDADVEEFGELANRLNGILPLVVSLALFVPKQGTPLQDARFGPTKRLTERVRQLHRVCSGGVRIQAPSPREALVQAFISHLGVEDADALVQAVDAGGHFSDLRRAFPERFKRLTR